GLVPGIQGDDQYGPTEHENVDRFAEKLLQRGRYQTGKTGRQLALQASEEQIQISPIPLNGLTILVFESASFHTTA
ncbi:MAG: hypothetical protein P8Z77_09980, partial [Candidatus Thiodiazotropha sp.]